MGFRKEKGTMDNIYVINYLANRKIGKVSECLIVMFVDLKATFDSVDRRVLVKTLRERGIREDLIERIGDILEETRSRVRVGEEMEDSL